MAMARDTMLHLSSNTVAAMRGKVFLLAAYWLVLVGLFVAAAEYILRRRGIEPWRPAPVAVRVSPGGRFFVKHPTLGYTHIPGHFIVTLGTGYSFRVTHLPDTLRITHPLDSYSRPGVKLEIWIFGCSFTHGWSL